MGSLNDLCVTTRAYAPGNYIPPLRGYVCDQDERKPPMNRNTQPCHIAVFLAIIALTSFHAARAQATGVFKPIVDKTLVAWPAWPTSRSMAAAC